MKKIKILKKVLLKSKNPTKSNPDSSESPGSSPKQSIDQRSSLLRPEDFSDTYFSDNMSDHVATNAQNAEMSANPTMRQAANASASTSMQPTGTQPDPLQASMLENMQSQDP